MKIDSSTNRLRAARVKVFVDAAPRRIVQLGKMREMHFSCEDWGETHPIP